MSSTVVVRDDQALRVDDDGTIGTGVAVGIAGIGDRAALTISSDVRDAQDPPRLSGEDDAGGRRRRRRLVGAERGRETVSVSDVGHGVGDAEREYGGCNGV